MTNMIKGKWPVHALLQNPSGSGIPFDVTFKIFGTENADNESASSREIKAHKQLLALHSSVFLSMFYGSLKEESDVIPVKETNYEAFKMLVEFIYQIDIDCQNMTVIDFYDIVNLAERYDVPSLTEEIKIILGNFPLDMDSLMDVAFTASQLTQFEDVSSTVLLTCAKFLQKNIFGPENLLQFAMDQHATARGEIALELLRLIEGLPPFCGNCFKEEDECLRWEPVEQEKMAHGLQVIINEESQYWQLFTGSKSKYEFTVLTVNGNLVTVEREGYGPYEDDVHSQFLINAEWGEPNFLYNCRC